MRAHSAPVWLAKPDRWENADRGDINWINHETWVDLSIEFNLPGDLTAYCQCECRLSKGVSNQRVITTCVAVDFYGPDAAEYGCLEDDDASAFQSLCERAFFDSDEEGEIFGLLGGADWFEESAREALRTA